MRSGLLLPPQRRPTPGALYVLGVGLLAALLLLLADTGVVHPALIAVIVIPLGPLGLLGAVGLTGLLDLLVPLVPLDAWSLGPAVFTAPVLAVVLLIAAVNVLIAARVLAASAGRPAPARYRGRLPVAGDRLLGGSAFLTAAGLLVALSFLAGFVALTAGGIDAPTPPAEAAQARLVAGATWGCGLVAAVAGLVLWIVAAARGTAMLRWGIADLAVQVLALSGLIAFLVAHP